MASPMRETPGARVDQEGNSVTQYIANVKSAPEGPYIFMDMILKSAAPVYFFFCTWFTSNFIINFVVTTVLIVSEFWYTKNITGRRLTGMRWWQVPSSESADTTWRFEHRALIQPGYKPSKPASFQFWVGMLGVAGYWGFMCFLSISKPGYLILSVMALFFVFMNMLGYYRCRTWSGQVLKAVEASGGLGGLGGMMPSGVTSGMVANFMSNM